MSQIDTTEGQAELIEAIALAHNLQNCVADINKGKYRFAGKEFTVAAADIATEKTSINTELAEFQAKVAGLTSIV